MAVLKSLAFTAMPKSTNDPVHIRRAKFIDKLEEQKLLLQDPAYIRTVQRMAEVDGQKQPVVRKQRIRPWWKTDPSGQIVMSIRFGAKPIELAVSLHGTHIVYHRAQQRAASRSMIWILKSKLRLSPPLRLLRPQIWRASRHWSRFSTL